MRTQLVGKDARLVGTPISPLTYGSRIKCSIECARDLICGSIVYNTISRSCEMYAYNYSAQTTRATGYSIYEYNP